MDQIKRLEDLILAIEEEQENERNYFIGLTKDKTKKERQESGLLITPAYVNSFHYSIGELIEIEIAKPENYNTNKFRVGKGCALHSEKEDRTYFGNISYENKKVIKVISKNVGITQHEIVHDRSLSLELTYDDRPYRIMKQTIREVSKSQNHTIKEWVKAINEKKDLSKNQIIPIHTDRKSILNSEQNEAVRGSIATDSMSIIHGPPGTGKTTTITEIVNLLANSNHKILVCAPSNNAVDLLTRNINEKGIKVLRLGNITRIGDSIAHLTLEQKMSNDKEWLRIKKIKIESEEARRQARSFKRNFGPQEKLERKRMLQESKELKKWARDLENRLQEDIIEKTEVICTTLMGAASSYLRDILFHTVIIDEASQALEPECWISMLKTEKVIFVGDHNQLPPTVKSKKANELGLSETILDRMSGVLTASFLLRKQYRMNDEILAFPNLSFYENKLYGDEQVKSRKISGNQNSVTFIDTAGCGFEEEFDYKTRSLKNPGEFFIIREHMLSIQERILGHSIGIICPYSEQVRHVRKAIIGDESLSYLDIEIDSIDGFQGQEKEIIYISLVRSNINGDIGFLKDWRRLNVALTRAMKKLVVIGDSATISSNPVFLSFLNHIEKNSEYLSAWQYMSV